MPGGWCSFDLAAEEVERRLGVSWGKAQKTLMELCEKGTLRWRNVAEGGPNVSGNDLHQWLTTPRPRVSQMGVAVQEAIDAIWKGQIDGVSNGDLVKRVSDWLETRGKSVPSRDTILRKAGRKR
jgi:hypothetical protein